MAARHKIRARQQGAVLVEAMIVASMLMLLLTCGLFFHAVYSAKLLTLREARAEAWQKAMAGCGGGLAAVLLNNLGAITALTEAEDLGLINAPDFLTDMGRGVSDPEPISAQAGPLLANHTVALRTRRSVACNEFGDQRSGDSNLGAILQAVRDLILSR